MRTRKRLPRRNSERTDKEITGGDIYIKPIIPQNDMKKHEETYQLSWHHLKSLLISSKSSTSLKLSLRKRTTMLVSLVVRPKPKLSHSSARSLWKHSGWVRWLSQMLGGASYTAPCNHLLQGKSCKSWRISNFWGAGLAHYFSALLPNITTTCIIHDRRYP